MGLDAGPQSAGVHRSGRRAATAATSCDHDHYYDNDYGTAATTSCDHYYDNDYGTAA